MPRKYVLGRRAQQQAETRQRIVDAAVDLHGTAGPAQTTISMLAEKAGVQRHTIYAHFPDERSLLMACSGHSLERNPPPDPEGWRMIFDPAERLRTGLAAIYGWYEGNAELLACVLRDAELHPLVREISHLRFGPHMKAFAEVLGAGLTGRQCAMLQLGLSFFTWRTLTRDAGLGRPAAVDMIVQAMTRV